MPDNKNNLNSQKAKKLMKQFEKETGKYAVWRGNVTEAFKKWLRKEKIYPREKERISLYVSEETKKRWQDFIIENKEEFPTFSELIRQSVKSIIEDSKKRKSALSKLSQKTISEISHALKEPLTSIKGYSLFLFENNTYKDKLSEDVKENLRNVLEQSILLENRIISFLDKIEISKQIKSNKKLRNIPFYLRTAIPGSEIEKYFKNSEVNGYNLKPFDFSEKDDDEDRYPYPYIYKPPEPPGDFEMATQLQVNKLIEKEPENEYICQYCGMKLTDEERISHNCRKSP